MGRSIKKGPYVDVNLETKVLNINEGKNKKSDIHKRCHISIRTLFRNFDTWHDYKNLELR